MEWINGNIGFKIEESMPAHSGRTVLCRVEAELDATLYGLIAVSKQDDQKGGSNTSAGSFVTAGDQDNCSESQKTCTALQ